MTTARSQLISLDVTPYYHCVSRCVRQSFLCGIDPDTGQSYEHRKSWVENRILELATIYCIEVCSYAVMSNHYHLVAHIDREKAQSLTNEEVVERWGRGHNLKPPMQRYLRHEITDKAELKSCEKTIQEWREHLYSLSWMMKELNQNIARRANEEDGCKGHFWEGRFKSHALLDQAALLSAMTYTDLNPVRAQIADTPETSEFTSLKKRLDSLNENRPTPRGLYPFVGGINHTQMNGIPFRLMDYIEWVDWVGRQVRADKRGYIDEDQPAILSRLSLNQTKALKLVTHLERKRQLWIGHPENIAFAKQQLNKTRIDGLKI